MSCLHYILSSHSLSSYPILPYPTFFRFLWLRSISPLFRLASDYPFVRIRSDAPFGGIGSDAPLGGIGSDDPLGGIGSDDPLGGMGSDAPLGGSGSDDALGGRSEEHRCELQSHLKRGCRHAKEYKNALYRDITIRFKNSIFFHA